ncbi:MULTISPECIES: tellurite resistance TerB family protein [Alphaproteobacteria]|uniref:Protein YebE n=2 Tax=Alphaproteobacteria TaxID=28211 RepID=A0A512HIZ2_9HYPH|nr:MULTISPECIES: tellurite resistance TerB family protein [Alphaproteobacteria]GEO85426.1 protein YebE [Ciceribacter naphthalenivorans]GLR21552.1 protein YebE [Ciceribacter naphthalenivorans]GLT04408.1 protein YebE [Sphingomonas psychrolutea]
MFDAKKLLDQFLGAQVPGTTGTVKEKAGDAVQLAKDNPLATGAIVAMLLGTKTGRELAGGALKIGGLAAIAGLGYQAYKNYQAGKAPQDAAEVEPKLLPPPAGSPFSVETPAASNDFALTLVRAMIAAAKCDGHIDAAERARIMDKIQLSGLGAEAGAFIEAELAAPIDVDALVGAAVSEEQKVELYTASRLAIDPDSRAERGYLDMLAGRLGLADGLVDHIEATVAAAQV